MHFKNGTFGVLTMGSTLSNQAISILMLASLIFSLAGCAVSSGQIASDQTINQALMTSPTPDVRSNDGSPVAFVDGGPIEITSLEQLISSDLIIEGTIAREKTRFVPDTTTTSAELAERQARGEPIGSLMTDYEVTVDKVIKGQVESTTVTVDLSSLKYIDNQGRLFKDTPSVQIGDRVVLFLTDISGDPIRAPGQTKYIVAGPIGEFRIEKDNVLSTHVPKGYNPIADTYRGKDKGVLEKDIQDLVEKLPKPSKEDALQGTLNGAELVIVGTIQGIGETHFINSMEKPQEWIDQMLAEGKMPGLVLTDYAIIVDKVLFDKRAYYPRFFPDWKPLESGSTIIVTRQGGTYRGVTQTVEPGQPFEIGSQEVLFLSGFSLANYDAPDDGQVRFTTDSRIGRFLIGANNKLTAFTTQGLGGIYGGLDVAQLEQDIVEFLKTHPFSQNIPAPSRP